MLYKKPRWFVKSKKDKRWNFEGTGSKSEAKNAIKNVESKLKEVSPDDLLIELQRY